MVGWFAVSSRRATRVNELSWLTTAADAMELALQRLARTLGEVVGCHAALLVMLPAGLMLRPLLSLMRSVQHSRLLLGACLLILGIGIAAGPLVGTRAGLVLVPIYVLGWTCSLNSLNASEAAELARARLARAGRRVRDKFVPLRARVARDQRN